MIEAPDGILSVEEPAAPSRRVEYAASLRIESIEIYPVSVPRRAVWMLQRGPTGKASVFTIVKLTTNTGIVGWGEAVTLVKPFDRIIRDHLVGAVVGRSPFDLVGLHREIDRVEMLANERVGAWNPGRSALDMACYDVMGRFLGLPVYQLLGGKQRERIPVVKNVGVDSVEETVERARALSAQGYSVLKLRVGADAELDYRRVRAVREALGEGLPLRLDANQAWDPKGAVATIERLAPYGLEAVEQPVKFWDFRGMGEVTTRVRVPIIADESVWTLDDARNLLAERGADVLHLYLGKCGGIWPSQRIAAVAASHDVAVTLGERVQLGISEAAHAHVAAALPALRYPCALAYDLNEHDLLTETLPKHGGAITVPDGPGLGVQVDEDALHHYARHD